MNLEQAIKYLTSDSIEGLRGNVIGLIGDLGAGKTHFTQSLLEAIDAQLKGQISSPTYNLCHVYQSKSMEVHHYDLYRIESEDDLFEVGFYDSLEQSNILVMVEWIDQFPFLQDRCDKLLKIAIMSNNERDYLWLEK